MKGTNMNEDFFWSTQPIAKWVFGSHLGSFEAWMVSDHASTAVILVLILAQIH